MTAGPLDGRRVLVTGAASGIGRAIALEIARQGAHVAGADLKEPAATVQQIREAGGRAVAIAGDVSKPASVQAMVEATLRELGGLDGLVNNAGVYSSLVPKPFDQITLEEWQNLFAVRALPGYQPVGLGGGRTWPLPAHLPQRPAEPDDLAFVALWREAFGPSHAEQVEEEDHEHAH